MGCASRRNRPGPQLPYTSLLTANQGRSATWLRPGRRAKLPAHIIVPAVEDLAEDKTVSPLVAIANERGLTGDGIVRVISSLVEQGNVSVTFPVA